MKLGKKKDQLIQSRKKNHWQGNKIKSSRSYFILNVWLKDNQGIFSIFYYRAVELIEEAGFKVGKSDGGLVTEAKPPVKWDKGNAAIYILKTAYGVHWADNIRVIFAGDDLTDEDAMKALKVAFTTYLRLYQNNCSIFMSITYLCISVFILMESLKTLIS